MAKFTLPLSVTLLSTLGPALALSGHANGRIDAREIQKRHHAALEERQARVEERYNLKHPLPVVPVDKRALSTHARRDGAAYTLLGCYSAISNTTGDGVLTIQVPWNMTSLQTCVESCATASSAPYVYAGVLAGEACLCDNVLGEGAVQVGQDSCTSVCVGSNGTEKWCGGPQSFQVYYLPGQEPTTSTTATTTEETPGTIAESQSQTSSDPVTASPTSADSTSSEPSATDTSSTESSPSTSSSPTTTGTPTLPSSITSFSGVSYQFAKCALDPWDPSTAIFNTRALRGPSFVSDSLTPTLCADFCFGNGYPLAGLEYGNECFCGATLFSEFIAEDCTMPCAGDKSQACGSTAAIALYQLSSEDAYQYTGPFPLEASGDFVTAGCYDNDPAFSAVEGWTPGAVVGDFSVLGCTEVCSADGFSFAALNATTCLCSHEPPASIFAADRRDCDASCPLGGGTCGGSWRVNVYAKAS